MRCQRDCHEGPKRGAKDCQREVSGANEAQRVVHKSCKPWETVFARARCMIFCPTVELQVMNAFSEDHQKKSVLPGTPAKKGDSQGLGARVGTGRGSLEVAEQMRSQHVTQWKTWNEPPPHQHCDELITPVVCNGWQ